jgi:hypothetical protein
MQLRTRWSTSKEVNFIRAGAPLTNVSRMEDVMIQTFKIDFKDFIPFEPIKGFENE